MNCFEPIHEHHGIASVIVVILLREPLRDFESTGHKLLEGQSVFNHHENSEQIRIESLGDGTTTKRSINGFLLRNDGNKQILQGFNDDIRTALIFTDTNYNRWEGFYDKLKVVLRKLQETLPENDVTAVALEYNDDFNWKGEVNHFKWSKLFKENCNTLSQDFHDHPLVKFEILRKRRIENKDMDRDVLEQISITRRTDTHVRIQHHLNLELKKNLTTKNLTDSKFTTELSELHTTNKEVLTTLLTLEMAERVGLITKTK